MALTGHQEAIELLLIEEADAWLSSTSRRPGPSPRAATSSSSRGRGHACRSGCARSGRAEASSCPPPKLGVGRLP